EEEEDVEGLDIEPENIMYDDFFLPPPRIQQSQRQRKHNALEPNIMNHDQTYEDISADMSRVHRDLFEESEGEEEPHGNKKNSLHMTQSSILAAEIRRLEMENVE